MVTMLHPHSFRKQRVADLIQRALAKLLQKKSHDPRFINVSITAVDVSRDFQNAKVFIDVLDEKGFEETLAALNKAAGFFRYQLAHSINLRCTPKLTFLYDRSVIHGEKLSRLIDAAIADDEVSKVNQNDTSTDENS